MKESNALVIVGGGPAGLAAAIEATKQGMKPTLIDEALQLGGQIYRQPPVEFSRVKTNHLDNDHDYLSGERLRRE